MATRGVPENPNFESLGTLLIREADILAREKCLSPQVLFECLEQSFQKVMADIYGPSHDIRVAIHRSSGAITVARYMHVVEHVHNALKEVSVTESDGVPVGEYIIDELPLPPFNRVTVQNLKTALVKNIQEVERNLQYTEFKDRVGHIVSGVVKQVENGNFVMDIGRAEGVILRNDMIPRENYRVGDRIKAYIYAVKREARGPQIFMSRTHPGFLIKLFAKEVPEIYDGLIEIKAAARDPGSRAKVAITSRDQQRSFDAIGACVGVRGNRVNAVSQELQGEKIDIIPWSPELPVFVINALTPAEAIKVIVVKDNHMKVVVPDHQQSIAIGRRGQNVKLAHQLTGCTIEIVTESVESQQRTQFRQEATALFMDKLDVDELMAHFLVSEGFETIEDLAQSSMDELTAMPGMTPEVATELKERAMEAVDEKEKALAAEFIRSGGDAAIVKIGFPVQALSCLLSHKVVSLEDLADLSLDELLDIIKPKSTMLEQEQWGELILRARSL
jgi:N utilization substance protein A